MSESPLGGLVLTFMEEKGGRCLEAGRRGQVHDEPATDTGSPWPGDTGHA